MNRILIAVLTFVVWTGFAVGAGWLWRGDRAEGATAKRDKADATAVVQAVQDARAIEHTKVEKSAAIGDKHEQDRSDAQSVPGAVVADLQSGALELRKELAGCATDRVSLTAAATLERDEAARLRNEIAGAVVQVGKDADDHVNASHAVIRADREAP